MVNIILLRVKPGKEASAIKNLQNSSVGIYHGFGRYDLVLVEDRQRIALANRFRTESFDFILDFDILAGFKWVPEERKEPKISQKKPILGVCCVKLALEALAGASVVLEEQKIAARIYGLATSKKISVCVCGGLGWHELLVLVESRSFKSLSDFVHCIKKEVHILRDITTIPCVSARFTGRNKLKEHVRAKLMVDLVGFSQGLKRIFKTRFKNVGSGIFGFHDYVASYSGKLEGLIESIKILRSRFGNSVDSTYTIIEHKPEDFEWASPSGLATTERIGKLKEAIRKKSKRQQGELSDLLFFLNLLESSLNEKKTGELFLRLDLLFENLYQVYRNAQKCKRKKKKDLEGYEYYEEIFEYVIDCIRMIFLQRYSGTQVGNLLGSKSLNIGSDGYSWRVIRSAEIIPHDFLDMFDLEWTGLCFFSYHGGFFRNPLGIIGFPSSSLKKTEEFWGIFHESGHEIFTELLKKRRLLNMLKRRRKEFIDTYRARAINLAIDRTNIEKLPLEADTDELVEEIFADAVDLHLGFCDDWKTYLRVVWPYIVENYPINENYVIRMLMLYLNLGPGRKHKTSNLRKTVDKGVKVLEQAGKLKLPYEIYRVAANTVMMFHTHGIDAEIFKIVRKANLRKSDYSKLNKIRSNFDKGIVMKDLDAISIVRALILRPIREYQHSTRIAGLLSLFDLYGKRLLLERTKSETQKR
jgi:hypothetical protein